MKREYFGTDGVRGPYGGPVINEAFAARLGFAAGRFFLSRAGAQKGKVVLARDTRESGQALLNAVASGLSAAGFGPVSLGVLPTPAVAMAVVNSRAPLGVMITASHNPAADNGIKFFHSSGMKLSDADEAAIESLLPDGPVPAASVSVPESDGLRDYLDVVTKLLPRKSLEGWRIVLDTANGATCATSPVVLRAFGAELTCLGNAPDGRNINAGTGSEYPEELAKTVKSVRARMGVAHDGDGDRCILCDETGGILDGDEILAILATHALSKGRLANQALVVTVQSNLGVDAAVAAAGGRVFRTPVGDRYVMERMRAEGATLGGESSGHIICSDVAPAGDGLVAALKVIEAMLATGKPLSELRRALKKFPQRSIALKVREKKQLDSLPTVSAAIASLEREFGARGRVLVRFSGTESKLRLLVEGPTEAIVAAGIAKLEGASRADLDVIA